MTTKPRMVAASNAGTRVLDAFYLEGRLIAYDPAGNRQISVLSFFGTVLSSAQAAALMP